MHLKNSYKKFHLKGMQETPEDALKNSRVTDCTTDFQSASNVTKQQLVKLNAGLWVCMIHCLYKVQTLQKGITTGQLLIS